MGQVRDFVRSTLNMKSYVRMPIIYQVRFTHFVFKADLTNCEFRPLEIFNDYIATKHVVETNSVTCVQDVEKIQHSENAKRSVS